MGTSDDDISTTTDLDSIVQIGSGAVDTSNSPEFMSAIKLGEFDIFSGNVISGGNDALNAVVTGSEDITQFADNGWVGVIGDVSQGTVRLDLFIGDILARADPFELTGDGWAGDFQVLSIDWTWFSSQSPQAFGGMLTHNGVGHPPVSFSDPAVAIEYFASADLGQERYSPGDSLVASEAISSRHLGFNNSTRLTIDDRFDGDGSSYTFLVREFVDPSVRVGDTFALVAAPAQASYVPTDFGLLSTAWNPGAGTARFGGNPTPGGATWSVMAAGVADSAFDDHAPAGDGNTFTTSLTSLYAGGVDEITTIGMTLDLWAAVSGFTNLGQVDDSGGAFGAAGAAGGVGDIRVGAIFIDGASGLNTLAHAFPPGTETVFGPGHGHATDSD